MRQIENSGPSQDVFAGCFSLKNVQAPDWIAKAIYDGEEMDHAACIERPPEEWRKLFLSYATGYGTRIDFYHGRQKLVYVPDWVNFVGGFNEDCAVICHKRVFDKFRNEIRINSALAYLNQPDKFPGDYANVPRNYIKKNRRVIEESSRKRCFASALPHRESSAANRRQN